MPHPIRTSRPLRPGDTVIPRRTGPDDRAATPEHATKAAIDWSRYLPISDDEMPA